MKDHRPREVDDRLADWVDERMTPRERERFVAELRVNPQLRADLQAYERTVAQVRAALRAPTTTTPIADRVLAAIDAGARPRPQVGPPARWRPWLLSLASAAALLALAVWLDGWRGAPAPASLTSGASAPEAEAPSPATVETAGEALSGDERAGEAPVAEPPAAGVAPTPPADPAAADPQAGGLRPAPIVTLQPAPQASAGAVAEPPPSQPASSSADAPFGAGLPAGRAAPVVDAPVVDAPVAEAEAKDKLRAAAGANPPAPRAEEAPAPEVDAVPARPAPEPRLGMVEQILPMVEIRGGRAAADDDPFVALLTAAGADLALPTGPAPGKPGDGAEQLALGAEAKVRARVRVRQIAPPTPARGAEVAAADGGPPTPLPARPARGAPPAPAPGAARTEDSASPAPSVERTWLVEGSSAEVAALVRRLAVAAQQAGAELANGEIAASALGLEATMVLPPNATQSGPALSGTLTTAGPPGPSTPGPGQAVVAAAATAEMRLVVRLLRVPAKR